VESVAKAGLSQMEFKLTEFFYMLLFPFGCPWMMPTEETGYPEWNQNLNQKLLLWIELESKLQHSTCCCFCWAAPQMKPIEDTYGLPWMESKFKPKTAVMD
jgi:hypothetical protein